MFDGIREDLIVRLDNVDIGQMLEFWRWLIPEMYQPLFATALGDLFFAAADGSIWWLNMGDGKLQAIAASEDEFRKAIVDPDNNSFWFGAELVDRLRSAGKFLRPGECYCYKLLPMLGGEYEPANFVVYDVVKHFRVWGPIHEQLHNLPDGTTIDFKITE